MKKLKIFSLIIVFVLCLSTVSYAVTFTSYNTSGYMGYNENTIITESGQASLSQITSAIIVRGSGNTEGGNSDWFRW